MFSPGIAGPFPALRRHNRYRQRLSSRNATIDELLSLDDRQHPDYRGGLEFRMDFWGRRMQALILLALLVFYLLDQLVGYQPVAGIIWRATGACLIIVSVPLLAAGLTAWPRPADSAVRVRKRWGQHRLIGIWFAGGMILIGLFNLGAIVRHGIGWVAWPPIDLLVVFAPLLLMLACGWAAECYAEYYVRRKLTGAEAIRACRQYVSIRTAVYLVPATLPLAAVLAAQSAGQGIAAWTRRAELEFWVGAGGILVIIGCLPILMSACWRARPLADNRLRTELDEFLRQRGVRFRDIRIWPTAQQFSNALVVGLLPRMKILILTDRLLQVLSRTQLTAVVAHEAGHVRRRHMLGRLCFVLLPLVFVFAFRFASGVTLGVSFDSTNASWAGIARYGWMALPAAYAAYAFLVIGWSSRRMETQADLFACGLTGERFGTRSDDQTKAFCAALLTLAQDGGEDIERAGWLHPSVSQRVRFLQMAGASAPVAASFERRFAWEKLAVVLIAMVAGAWIGLS